MRVGGPGFEFTSTDVTLMCVPVHSQLLLRIQHAGRRQRQQTLHEFMLVHTHSSLLPKNRDSIAARRPSKARLKRLFTVESGILATSAISSSFMFCSKRRVSTSRWIGGNSLMHAASMAARSESSNCANASGPADAMYSPRV